MRRGETAAAAAAASSQAARRQPDVAAARAASQARWAAPSTSCGTAALITRWWMSPNGLPPKSAASPKMRCIRRGTCSPGRVAGASDASTRLGATASAAGCTDTSSNSSVASERTHAHSNTTLPRTAAAGTAHWVARSVQVVSEGISSRVRSQPSTCPPEASSNSSRTPTCTAGIVPRADRTQACTASCPRGSGSGSGWRSRSEVQLSTVLLSDTPALPLRCCTATPTVPHEGDLQT